MCICHFIMNSLVLSSKSSSFLVSKKKIYDLLMATTAPKIIENACTIIQRLKATGNRTRYCSPVRYGCPNPDQYIVNKCTSEHSCCDTSLSNFEPKVALSGPDREFLSLDEYSKGNCCQKHRQRSRKSCR